MEGRVGEGRRRTSLGEEMTDEGDGGLEGARALVEEEDGEEEQGEEDGDDPSVMRLPLLLRRRRCCHLVVKWGREMVNMSPTFLWGTTVLRAQRVRAGGIPSQARTTLYIYIHTRTTECTREGDSDGRDDQVAGIYIIM